MLTVMPLNEGQLILSFVLRDSLGHVLPQRRSVPSGSDEDLIGLIPVNVRQFDRHFIALPADDEGGLGTYNDYDSVVFKGQASLHGIIANSAKSMGNFIGKGWPVWDAT
jgi:hypothetical protein